MPGRTVFLDTSFVLALENRDDPCHAKAKAWDRRLLREDATLLLHPGILLEIGDGYARVERRRKGAQLLEMLTHEDGYRVEPLTEAIVHEAMALYSTRMDKDWGLTDCVSFVLMQRGGVTGALTADSHFRQAGSVALLLET